MNPDLRDTPRLTCHAIFTVGGDVVVCCSESLPHTVEEGR
jgi:hypothetical protein